MKNFKLLGILAVACLFSFTSCKKSYKCCGKVGGVEICDTIERDDFDSDEEFKDYIKGLEDNGADCK
jgi:hypothetical protein